MGCWRIRRSQYHQKSAGAWHQFLIYREEEREMLPLCRAENIGVLPWSPLSRGFLSGNRKRKKGGKTLRARTDRYAKQMYAAEEDFLILDRVLKLTRRKKVKPTQIALSWLLHKPDITAPVLGIRKVEHLEEAIEALDLTLSDAEQQYLEKPYRPRAIQGHE